MRHFVREHTPDPLDRLHRGRLRIGQQVDFAIKNRGGVLHGAGGEVGHRDDVELLKGIGDRVVAVVVAEDPLGGVERQRAEPRFVRRRAHTNRHLAGSSLEALKIANCHGHQIRRHFRRLSERQRMSACTWTGHIGEQPAVRDRGIALIDGQPNRKGGLE
jgi:hypothetical protein